MPAFGLVKIFLLQRNFFVADILLTRRRV